MSNTLGWEKPGKIAVATTDTTIKMSAWTAPLQFVADPLVRKGNTESTTFRLGDGNALNRAAAFASATQAVNLARHSFNVGTELQSERVNTDLVPNIVKTSGKSICKISFEYEGGELTAEMAVEQLTLTIKRLIPTWTAGVADLTIIKALISGVTTKAP